MWRPSWDSHELVSSETFWAIPPGIFIGISWGVLFQEISYNIIFRNNSPFASGVFPGIPPRFLSVSDFKEIPLNIYLKIRICIPSEISEGILSGILFWFFFLRVSPRITFSKISHWNTSRGFTRNSPRVSQKKVVPAKIYLQFLARLHQEDLPEISTEFPAENPSQIHSEILIGIILWMPPFFHEFCLKFMLTFLQT